jgi:hypothetical protein
MPSSDTLADILERVLDTGIVVAGDIRVQLADIELLTIQIRLIVCSVDRAEELGMDWWRTAPYLSSNGRPETSRPIGSNEQEFAALDERLDRLENSIAALAEAGSESSKD